MNPEPYTVDDRGNVAQFYYTESEDLCATLNRECGPEGDQYEWDGDEDVTAWAETHGYPDIREVTKTN